MSHKKSSTHGWPSACATKGDTSCRKQILPNTEDVIRLREPFWDLILHNKTHNSTDHLGNLLYRLMPVGWECPSSFDWTALLVVLTWLNRSWSMYYPLLFRLEIYVLKRYDLGLKGFRVWQMSVAFSRLRPLASFLCFRSSPSIQALGA